MCRKRRQNIRKSDCLRRVSLDQSRNVVQSISEEFIWRRDNSGNRLLATKSQLFEPQTRDVLPLFAEACNELWAITPSRIAYVRTRRIFGFGEGIRRVLV